MTIDQIKEKLNHHLGNEVMIKCNMGRNKYEKYNAVIKDLYRNVFTVLLTNEDKEEIKSFSYSDVIMKTIKIDYLK